MHLIHENIYSPQTDTTINLICVFRDEVILLPHFIDYYKALGVSQFYLIDNDSVDQGSAYLQSRKDINIKLFHTKESYRDSIFGTTWRNKCMKEFCQNEFCLNVDVDELLLLDKRRYSSIHSLAEKMKKEEKTVAPAILLDLYPKEMNDTYKAGQDFSEHSHYFDDLNNTYYRKRGILYSGFPWLEGGLRARTLDTYNITHKFPIMYYIFNENTVEPNPHFFSINGKSFFDAPKVKLNPHPVILLHYKFIKPNFLNYLKEQIENGEHWRDGLEYKKYYETLKSMKTISFYDANYSKRYDSLESLDKFWNINETL